MDPTGHASGPTDSTPLVTSNRSRLAPGLDRIGDWPWWLIVAILLGLLILYKIITEQQTHDAFLAVTGFNDPTTLLTKGIVVTLTVAVSAYALAILIGLVVGLLRVSSNRVILNVASFYVEIVRGVPILVLLMYIAFVAVPLGVDGLNAAGQALLTTRLGAATLAATGQDPAWSPDGRQIAFASEQSGNLDVYIANANGQQARNLTDDPAPDHSPAWSPDGRQLAFVSERDGQADLYLVNADGSGLTRLTTAAGEDTMPAWSPDGARLAFVSNRAGNHEIYALTIANPSEIVRLTNHRAQDESPAWSPDGLFLAYVSDREGNRDVLVLDLEKTTTKNPTKNDFDDYAPAWSANGRELTFVSTRAGNPELYSLQVVSVVENEETGARGLRLDKPVRLTNTPASEDSPDWAKGGQLAAAVDGGLTAWLASLNLAVGAGLARFATRDFPNEIRVIVALAFAYGAFESEVFRAGIQSIEKGQMEAARALGMSYVQAMRHIILPQAIRRVLPALGNDFIAMLKDSSLVSVLGVEDITQKAKLYAASSFLFFQTYSVLAFIYLTMTILLSRGVRTLENRLSQFRR